jgi:inner membrane protein
MDNITHSLTGLAIARAGLNRFCPRATLLLILSANAPDGDVITALRGPFQYFEAHRGYSHSLACLPFLAVVPVFLTAAIFRQQLPWIRAWILSCIGIASHLLLDCTNSYGVRLFLPFSSRWLHLDWNNLYDVCILLVLVFGAIWPLFARLVSREIGGQAPLGRGTAVFALTFFLLFDLGRAVLHNRAIAQLESLLYDDRPPRRVAALPDSFNPFRWTGVVETPNAFQLMTVNTRGQVDAEESQTFYKPEITPSLEAVKTDQRFRYFIYFARFPVWSESPVITDRGQATRVQLTDLRFGRPDAGSFHCVALVNPDHHLVQSWFTFGSGANLGWGARQRASALNLLRRHQRLADNTAAQLHRIDRVGSGPNRLHRLFRMPPHRTRSAFQSVQN